MTVGMGMHQSPRRRTKPSRVQGPAPRTALQMPACVSVACLPPHSGAATSLPDSRAGHHRARAEGGQGAFDPAARNPDRPRHRNNAMSGRTGRTGREGPLPSPVQNRPKFLERRPDGRDGDHFDRINGPKASPRLSSGPIVLFASPFRSFVLIRLSCLGRLVRHHTRRGVDRLRGIRYRDNGLRSGPKPSSVRPAL